MTSPFSLNRITTRRQFKEMIYFGDHGPGAPLATSMVSWQLHGTVIVLDKDYYY